MRWYVDGNDGSSLRNRLVKSKPETFMGGDLYADIRFTVDPQYVRVTQRSHLKFNLIVRLKGTLIRRFIHDKHLQQYVTSMLGGSPKRAHHSAGLLPRDWIVSAEVTKYQSRARRCGCDLHSYEVC